MTSHTNADRLSDARLAAILAYCHPTAVKSRVPYGPAVAPTGAAQMQKTIARMSSLRP